MEERVLIQTSNEAPPKYTPPRTPMQEYEALRRQRDKKLKQLNEHNMAACTLRQEIYKLDREIAIVAEKAGLRTVIKETKYNEVS